MIDGSRIGDLYLNTKTDVLYRRTDDNNSAYTWTKIAELKGKTGDSNYEIWLEIPGNEGKSKVQYIEYMRNQFKQVKRVWDKPLLSNEGTDLNCIYYYQEGENAWLSKLYVPDTQDFGIGKYTYFDGIRWLSFENNTQVIPSHTMKDTLYFYCVYDERLLKCRAHSVNKQTGEDKALGNGWVDLTISDTKPDDSYQLHETRLERLGKWKTTLYAGDTKADALEVTEDGTSSLDGVITTDIFNSILGTVDLATEDKTIKGAINEVNTNKVDKTDITTTIGPMSTHSQIPSAKTMYDTLKITLIGSKQLNAYGKEIIKYPLGRWGTMGMGVKNLTDLPNDSVKYVEILGTSDSATPWTVGLSTRTYRATTEDGTIFTRSITSGEQGGVIEKDTGWQKVCSTSVADVSKTNITSKVLNATVNPTGGVSYSVKNGICYVQFTSVTTAATSNGQYILLKGTLPPVDNSLSNGRYPVVGGGSKIGMVSVDDNTGGVRYYGGAMTIFTTISYPVSES